MSAGAILDGRFELVRQIGSGPDGARYLAVDSSDGSEVIVERIFAARNDGARFRALRQRLRLLEGIDHPSTLRGRAQQVDGPDPYVVTELPTRVLGAVLSERKHALEPSLRDLCALAELLREAHRLGLAHGSLRPSNVFVDPARGFVVDLRGLKTRAPLPPTADDAACDDPHAGPASAHDVYAFGRLLHLVVASCRADDPAADAPATTARIEALVEATTRSAAEERLSMHEVHANLRSIERASSAGASRSGTGPRSLGAAPGALEPGTQVGRFRIQRPLGAGGMGQVYRAVDTSGGADVALKLLHGVEPSQVVRFRREAYLLSQLDNPHIARFVELGEDLGGHFLAMELVEGESLNDRLEKERKLDPRLALDIVRDVALALADVHDLGVVHRDVKPANILLTEVTDGSGARRVVAKLCDFGIAREVERGQDLTQQGMAIGTPSFMAPEQCLGRSTDARTDVYALGVTLFRMLSGELPFEAPTEVAILLKHVHEVPPDVRERGAEVDDRTAMLVGRMLEKDPAHRFADARSLLEEVERARRGDPTHMGGHPRLPEVSESKLQRYTYAWELAASPAELWPHVSNTERLNRAIGLDAIEFSRRSRGGGVETYGKIKLSGLLLEWREHAYEWVAPSRMGVLREFSSGPFVWMRSVVTLQPRPSGGTHLSHQIELEPRGVLGRAAAAMEVGFKARRNLERVYRQIDRFVAERSPEPHDADGPTRQLHAGAVRIDGRGAGEASVEADVLDPFEPPPDLSETQRARIDAGHGRLLDRGVRPEVADRVAQHLRWASAQDVARIRPRAFAAAHGFDAREVLDALLLAAEDGLLVLLWDLICPRCQIPSSIEQSLRNLREHGHCDACAVDFALDFAQSVEVVFRAHPSVRTAEVRTYCIGGPAHTPHVLAQVELEPGARCEIALELDEGAYRVVGRELERPWPFRVRAGAPFSRWEIPLGHAIPPSEPHQLAEGAIDFVVANDLPRTLVARIERVGERSEAFTAAEACRSPLLRALFPGEVLAPGQLVSVSRVAFVAVALCDAWTPDAREVDVYARVAELGQWASDAASAEGGAIVKLHGDGVLLVFGDPVAALRAALALRTRDASLAIAAHTGSCMVTSLNERLDYFGRVVRELDELLLAAPPGSVLVSEALGVDPGVAQLVEEQTERAMVRARDGKFACALRPSAS